MELKDTDLRFGIKATNSPYHCSKCNSTHRPGTKIWEEHLNFASITSLSQAVHAKAAIQSKQSARESKKFFKKWHAGEETKLLKNYHKLAKGVRYYFWEASASSVRSSGACDGYATLEELKQDHKYSFEEAAQGKSVVVIYKAVPFKVIKARSVDTRYQEEKKKHRTKKE